MNARILLAALTTTALTGLASAQMVTDAPKTAPDPSKEIKKGYEPPASNRPPVQKKMIATRDKDGNIKFVPEEQAGKGAEPARPVKATEPAPAYKSLVVRDAKGNLVPLKEPVDIAALKQNPTIDGDTMAKIEPYLVERRARMEQLVIENLNVIDEIHGGALEKIGLGDNEGLTKVRSLVKPLMPPNAPKGLTDELRARSLISQRQADVNKQIASEYTRATIPAAPANASQDDKKDIINQMMSHTLRQSVSEALLVHHDLVLEATGKFSELLPKLGLATDVADRAKGMLTATGDDDAKFKAATNALAQLPLEKRQELLKAAIAARPAK